MLTCFAHLSRRHFTHRQSKQKFGEFTVNFCRLAKVLYRLRVFGRLLCLNSKLIGFVPIRQVALRQSMAVSRTEWRAIHQIDRDSAHNHPNAMFSSRVDNLLEIALEISIHTAHTWIVGAHLLSQKHLHPLPLTLVERGPLQRTNE